MPTGTAAGVAIFTPNQANNGFNLMGRPAVIMEQCESLGTSGDLIAFATDGYACITKGGIESFMSMHLRFDYDETAYKWRFRFDGQPYDLSPLTPYKGANTVSSIVTLNSNRT
jgi:HK97 family phage major capsid protein